MIFTIDAKPGDVRQHLAERGTNPMYVEWDDTNKVTEVSVTGSDQDIRTFVLDLARTGWRWWRGRGIGFYADPTYARAEQRVMRRSAGR